ncbi:CD151 antigen-like [Gigantopelta aegis]|uniref:CD151 antigen-like n=1 Tax=Gigantopelta aegis TaxID=1735272 RepID=UPI001B88C9A9|nr:CD151 antigen-like [Gigantopelta aegis]
MVYRNRKKDDGCCSLTFLRYVLFVFNIMFWITGVAFLSVGVWTMMVKHKYVSLLGNSTYPATTILFIVTGVFIILVGALGCLGALRNIRCCLVMYAFLLLMIFLLEAIAGVLAYMYEGSIKEELTRNLNKTIIENYNFDSTISDAVDNLQKQFHCCGAESYRDWRWSRWLKLDQITKNKAPDSCCISPAEKCAVSISASNIYHTGCSPQLERFIKRHLIVIGGIGLGLCCIQVFGIIFACCLARKIKEITESY